MVNRLDKIKSELLITALNDARINEYNLEEASKIFIDAVRPLI